MYWNILDHKLSLPKQRPPQKHLKKTHHLEFIIHFQSNCDDPQNLEKQTSKFQKNPPESLRILSLPIGLGSPSGDGVPITGARKSLTTTTPKDDAGNVWISKFSRCWKMWKLEATKTEPCVKDMQILLVLLTSCQYVWRRIKGTMWLFLNALTLEKLEMWGWCINTNHKMNTWNKRIWVPTTEQPHNKWGRRKNYMIFGVAFDGWSFIREACQEFKGCLRFKDFLQLMRLILDFQATQCWTKKVVWITLIYHISIHLGRLGVVLFMDWEVNEFCMLCGWKHR